MKLGGTAPIQPSTSAPGITTPTDSPDLDFDQGTSEPAGSSEKPFKDEPFNAGVEADENSDPKKYIEQLTGKLGQSLRKYEETQGQPDFELEKFAINSLLAATHTGEMDEKDQKDIINKVSNSGKGDEPQSSGDNETPTAPETAPETGEQADELNEMSLNDHNTKKLISVYDNGSDNIKQFLTRMVSFGNEGISREQFIADLQDEVDYEELEYIFSKLKEAGIDIPKDPVPVHEDVKKNNMFQKGSNDILEEVGCKAGYKQLGTKEEDGKQVPNCIKINENLGKQENNSIFANKESIKSILKESFNQEDMTQPTTEPTVKPKPVTKPSTNPTIKPIEPSRRNKPFQPNVTPGVRPEPKAMEEASGKLETYYPTFSAAVQAAAEYALSKGYSINDDQWFQTISTGPKKPSEGQTNRYSIELFKDGKIQKKQLHIQVYGMSNNYELNAYIA